MRNIREGLLRIEQEHPENELVTQELVQRKSALIFGVDVATQFIAMLKGDVVYSILTDKNLNITIPDALKGKITYIKASGRLQCLGVLTEAEKTDLGALIGATPAFLIAVQALYEKPERFIKDHFAGA